MWVVENKYIFKGGEIAINFVYCLFQKDIVLEEYQIEEEEYQAKENEKQGEEER